MGRIEIDLPEDLEEKIRSSGKKPEDLIRHLLSDYFQMPGEVPARDMKDLQMRKEPEDHDQMTISLETKISLLEMEKERLDRRWAEIAREPPLTDMGKAITEELKRSERNIQRLESTSKRAHDVSERTEAIASLLEATSDKAHLKEKAVKNNEKDRDS